MVELTLKPCPFCGISPILATTPGWIWHDANGCRLVGKHPIGWWQSRIDTPPPSSTPEVVEAVTAALVALAQRNIPTDVQELLVGGNPAKGIAPGALRAAIAALPPSNMIGEAIEALEPFAALVDGDQMVFTDDTRWTLVNGERRFGAISMHSLRKARATLSKLRGEG